jgi:hypothetical protein
MCSYVHIMDTGNEPVERTKGPSETRIAERLAPYRCFASVCCGMPRTTGAVTPARPL